MNPQTYKEAEDLVAAIIKSTKVVKGVEIVLCPPFTWLTDFSHKNESAIAFGAQDVFYEEKGAFTGEISPQMLKSSKVDYVIIGHSERRKYFGETNETVNKKIKAVLKEGLKVIFCVGENEGQEKQTILENQVAEGLKGTTKEELKHVTIAYEPVWAIGTGKNCSTDETMKAMILIRKIVTNLYNREAADNVKLLYGGSVSAQNSADYLKNGGVNGLLVGGASLKPEEFIAIIKSIS